MSKSIYDESHLFTKDFYKIESLNLENLSIDDFKKLFDYINILRTSKYRNLNNSLLSLPPLSLEEIKLNTKRFMDKHFDLYDVCFASSEELEANNNRFILCSVDEFNSMLDDISKMINVHDLDVQKLEEVPSLFYSQVGTSMLWKDDNRIPTFDSIQLGPPYNIISSAVLSHEIVHIQEQGVLAYERDFLNDEFLSIFVEKACMDELDPSKQILKLYERHRFSKFIRCFLDYLFEENKSEQLDYLVYLKSTLLAIKLFDMYQHDSDKESYFKDIQKVFDGNWQVEDIIESRKLKLVDCFDRDLLKRHM